MTITNAIKTISMAAAGATIATFAVVSGASASPFSYSGAGGLVPPTGSGGGLPDSNNTFTSSIFVADDISIDNITVNLEAFTHTWVGDLVATIEHEESGQSVDLFHRVGLNNPVPPTCCGDSTNLGGNYSFNDSFTGDLWFAADQSDPIASGDYFASTINGAQSFLGDFTALTSAVGTWTLSIYDGAGGDQGSLGSWSIDVEGESVEGESVPEPASLLGLMIFGAIGVGSRLKGDRRQDAVDA